MAEILGAVAAASGLLGQSIKVIREVDKAREAKEKHSADMAKYLEILEMTEKSLKEDEKLIEQIEELRTEHVRTCAKKIESRSQELQELVKKISLHPGFFHKLFRWGGESSELKDKVDEIHLAEDRLSKALIGANVGLTKRVFENQGTVNSKLVLETNARVQQIVGSKRELAIAGLIKHKTCDGNGNVTLDQEELSKLAEMSGTVDGRMAAIQNNTTRDQALQFNAPIGTDLWKDLAQLDIHHNLAEGQSRQFNYAQTMDVYHDQMARILPPPDYRFYAILVAAIAALYIIYGR